MTAMLHAMTDRPEWAAQQQCRCLGWMFAAVFFAVLVTVLATIAKDPWFALVALVLWFLGWNRWSEYKRIEQWVSSFIHVSGETPNGSMHCSFCGKPQDAVRTLISSPSTSARICEDCVEVCKSILDADGGRANAPS